MKSTVPTGTIEVSAHIQIAIDKEGRGSPAIIHLDQTKKKKLSCAECTSAGTMWDPMAEVRLTLLKKTFLICFQCSCLFLTSDDPTTMYSINIVWCGKNSALLNSTLQKCWPLRVQCSLKSDCCCSKVPSIRKDKLQVCWYRNAQWFITVIQQQNAFAWQNTTFQMEQLIMVTSGQVIRTQYKPQSKYEWST